MRLYRWMKSKRLCCGGEAGRCALGKVGLGMTELTLINFNNNNVILVIELVEELLED